MKRIIIAVLIFMMSFCVSAPFSYAKEYVHTSGENKTESLYATREQAVAKFVSAVGMDTFDVDIKVLNRFSDKEKISYANLEKVAAAVSSGLIVGYEDGKLRPGENISRIEALTILNRALNEVELADTYDVKFSDTPEWAEKQVSRLAAAGIIKGYGDGTLGVRDLLTNEQIKILCDRIKGYMGPAGDYYEYINSMWMNDTVLEDGVDVVSDIDRLNRSVSSKMSDTVFSLYRRCYNNDERFAEDSAEKRIITVYSAAANQAYRDKIGVEPLREVLDKINSAANMSELLEVMAELEKCGFSTLVKVGVGIDEKSGIYIPAVNGCYIGMDCERFADFENIEAYKEYIKTLFEISGEDDFEIKSEQAVDLCGKLAEAMGKNTAATEAVEFDAESIGKLFSEIDIVKYFEDIGFKDVRRLIVYDEEFAGFVNRIFSETETETLKSYLKAAVLDASAIYLSTDTFDAYLTYQNKLNGTNVDVIPSDYAMSAVCELLGWELGSLYVEECFPENAKSLVEEMTSEIIEEYAKMIKKSTRISPQSANKIKTKLKNIKINAAYPDDTDSYFKTDVEFRPAEEGGSLVEYRMLCAKVNAEKITEMTNNKEMRQKDRWSMYPQTVNAMYDAASNSITIPAGILQAPYFEASASYEQNLGGIGTVIAHEISHAFDSEGIKFDENGKPAELCTAEEKSAFSDLYKKMAEEYGNIKINGMNVDGERTLNENTADIAAMECIINLIGGDDIKLDRMFKSYAKTHRVKATDEYIKSMLQSDVHSPDKVRVNRVLSNFDEFKRVYGIVEGDGMYIPEDGVIRIWRH